MVSFGAEYVENDAGLGSCGRTVAANDPLAATDTLISRYELVENVLAVVDAILEDSLLLRVTSLYESVENGNSVSETRTPDRYGPRVEAEDHRAFQDRQAYILWHIEFV